MSNKEFCVKVLAGDLCPFRPHKTNIFENWSSKELQKRLDKIHKEICEIEPIYKSLVEEARILNKEIVRRRIASTKVEVIPEKTKGKYNRKIKEVNIEEAFNKLSKEQQKTVIKRLSKTTTFQRFIIEGTK